MFLVLCVCSSFCVSVSTLTAELFGLQPHFWPITNPPESATVLYTLNFSQSALYMEECVTSLLLTLLRVLVRMSLYFVETSLKGLYMSYHALSRKCCQMVLEYYVGWYFFIIYVKFVFTSCYTHRMPLLCKKWNLVVFPQNKETTFSALWGKKVESLIRFPGHMFAKGVLTFLIQ